MGDSHWHELAANAWHQAQIAISEVATECIVKEYLIDVSEVTSWADFVAAFNKGFVQFVGGGEWDGNLDAFNDYLSWPEEQPYRLTIHGWQLCASGVNRHKTWDQRPVLEIVAEIFRDNPQAEVILTEAGAVPDDSK